MSKQRAIFTVKAAVVLILALAAIYAATLSISGKSKPINIGQPAPDFTLEDLNGEERQLSELRGRSVLLNFWASWCNPCVNELPLLNEAYKLLKTNGENITFIAINIGEKSENIQKFIDRYDLELPIWLDEQRNVNGLYRVSAMPLTLLIDPSGDIVEIHAGELTDIADIIALAGRSGL